MTGCTSKPPGSNGRWDCVNYVEKGFRDVYWCYALNEPVILTYKNIDGVRAKFCTNCDNFMGDYPDYHTFICNIRKPR